MPTALEEMKAIKVYYRRQIAQAIEEQLPHQPTVETKNRKPVPVTQASFRFEPPLWELRVGAYRVFYDVDQAQEIVFVRAVRDKPPHATTEEVL
jgi:mRNA-degrading endonuclease RelE of RelBE toxin-antitoxin system